MGPNSKILNLQEIDEDGIRIAKMSQVWIDHNTLYVCQEGLINITEGSIDITLQQLVQRPG